MQPDTTIEQEVSTSVVVESEPHSPGAEKTFGEESDGLQNAAGNLTNELSDLVVSNSEVDLSDEEEEMDKLTNELNTLTVSTGKLIATNSEAGNSDVQNETNNSGVGDLGDKQIPFPEVLIRFKKLEPVQEQLLLEQWQEFNRLKGVKVTRNPLLERAQRGEPELTQGTLLHGTTFSPEMMKSIKEKGILSGEFVGIQEEYETHYCADFFRVPQDMKIQDYQTWITVKERAPGSVFTLSKSEQMKLVTPKKPDKVVSFIVDSQQPEVADLLKEDAYSQKSDPELRKINEGSLLNPKGDEDTRRMSAIFCGVPSNFINGIIVSTAVSPEEIGTLRQTFGENVAIYDASGELLKKEEQEAPEKISLNAPTTPEKAEESDEEKKTRIDHLWSAWDEIQKKPELVALFDRKGNWDADKDPKQMLSENGYPQRTKIPDLQFENWKVNLNQKFIKDGHVYLLRGDHPGLEKKGFYSRPYGYGKQTTQALTTELSTSEDVGYFLTQNDRFLKMKPQSGSIAQQLAYQQSAMGGSSFISATTNVDTARAGTGNQPDAKEQKEYKIYVLRIPEDSLLNSNTGNHFGMKEEENLIPDYVSPDEIVGTFNRDDEEAVFQYMNAQLGITREDLGMTAPKT